MVKITPTVSVVFRGTVYPAGVEADVDDETAKVLRKHGGRAEAASDDAADADAPSASAASKKSGA